MSATTAITTIVGMDPFSLPVLACVEHTENTTVTRIVPVAANAAQHGPIRNGNRNVNRINDDGEGFEAALEDRGRFGSEDNIDEPLQQEQQQLQQQLQQQQRPGRVPGPILRRVRGARRRFWQKLLSRRSERHNKLQSDDPTSTTTTSSLATNTTVDCDVSEGDDYEYEYGYGYEHGYEYEHESLRGFSLRLRSGSSRNQKKYGEGGDDWMFRELVLDTNANPSMDDGGGAGGYCFFAEDGEGIELVWIGPAEEALQATLLKPRTRTSTPTTDHPAFCGAAQAAARKARAETILVVPTKANAKPKRKPKPKPKPPGSKKEEEEKRPSHTATLHAPPADSAKAQEPQVPVQMQPNLQLPTMEERLLATGLVKRKDFDFVPDTVSKEVLALHHQSACAANAAKETKTETDTETETKTKMRTDPNENDAIVSHVKTGIWEITTQDGINGTERKWYVVTGVCMDDRVDTKRFRKLLFPPNSNNNNSKKQRPKITMAPTAVAEGLVGFRSGTMAPICHLTPMKLYLEESIVSKSSSATHPTNNNNNNNSNEDETRDERDHPAGHNHNYHHHRLNVGSGMFGKCLSIPLDKFLQIAEASPQSLEICSLIQTKKTKNPAAKQQQQQQQQQGVKPKTNPKKKPRTKNKKQNKNKKQKMADATVGSDSRCRGNSNSNASPLQ